MILKQMHDQDGKPSGTYIHYCPGCKYLHNLPTPRWNFDGNLESPTFTPSFVQQPNTSNQCHYVITNGILNYCADSHHELKGQAIPMPHIPEDLI